MLARRDEGAYSIEICNQGATKTAARRSQDRPRYFQDTLLDPVQGRAGSPLPAAPRLLTRRWSLDICATPPFVRLSNSFPATDTEFRVLRTWGGERAYGKAVGTCDTDPRGGWRRRSSVGGAIAAARV
ncbi:hypothetical protein SBV1_1570027 [Verrucomicrobia bacterium]|nr:hypothetical protein SBV1_1570027 [Verrucomicrobiota bacterium]